MGFEILHADIHQPFGCDTGRNDLRDRLRARLETRRRSHVLGFLIHPGKFHHGSTEIRRWQRLQHVALAVEEADTGRAVHLMRAPCREVNVQSVEVDLQVRYGLACVEHNHRAYLVRTFHHRRDVGDGTGGVAHMGDGHDLCAFGDHLVRSVGKDATFTVQIEPFQCRSGTHGKLLERQ